MKKLFLATIIPSLILAGCGGSDDGNTNKSVSSTPAKEVIDTTNINIDKPLDRTAPLFPDITEVENITYHFTQSLHVPNQHALSTSTYSLNKASLAWENIYNNLISNKQITQNNRTQLISNFIESLVKKETAISAICIKNQENALGDSNSILCKYNNENANDAPNHEFTLTFLKTRVIKKENIGSYEEALYVITPDSDFTNKFSVQIPLTLGFHQGLGITSVEYHYDGNNEPYRVPLLSYGKNNNSHDDDYYLQDLTASWDTDNADLM